jgi:hypothetical protein
LTNTTTLQEISYPVFKLPDKPNKEDGILYYYSESERGGELKGKLQIVDDTNLPGASLASRRLQILKEGGSLYRLHNAIFFLGDLIKVSTSSTYFIDSNGKLFKYKKSTSAKLRFYPINNIFPISTGGAIIDVKGIPSRFKTLIMPDESVRYAGILHMGMANILYGLYSELPKDTRRKL